MNKSVFVILFTILLSGCSVAPTPENPTTDTIAQPVGIAAFPSNNGELKKGNDSGYEIPQIKDEKVPSQIVRHKGFTLSFNSKTLCPNWVAWCLTRSEAASHNVERTNIFNADSLLPEKSRLEYYDYSRTSYDRGHMAPAGDMRWSKRAMEDCFLMSNMCPQNHDLNEGDWNSLEMACRRWAKSEGEIYITCGPIYEEGREPFHAGKKRISIPDHFYKVVMILTPGNERAAGFIFQNTTGAQPMHQCIVTVDEVEDITGIDFFASVPQEVQERIERKADPKYWNW